MSTNRGSNVPYSLKERQAVIRENAADYGRSDKTGKASFLDHLVRTTKLNRTYLATALRTINLVVTMPFHGTPVRFKADHRLPRRKRKSTYLCIRKALIWFWRASDFICSKRLEVFIRNELAGCLARQDISLSGHKIKLMSIVSPATIDRQLKEERKKYRLRSIAHTRPGALLKSQIPVRRSGDFPDHPGYFEIDLVGHDGGDSSGDFCSTLTITDISTCWTVLRGLRNKAHRWVMEAMAANRLEMPMPILGIDSDNGAEFINHVMLKWCQAPPTIEFTRSRTGRKNDNCHVEQKNNSIARRALGRDRYDTDEQHAILVKLCERYSLYANLYSPVFKVKKEIQPNGRTKKIYVDPQTPMARVLARLEIDEKTKESLRKLHAATSPIRLLEEIRRLQARLQRSCQKGKRQQERECQMGAEAPIPPLQEVAAAALYLAGKRPLKDGVSTRLLRESTEGFRLDF